MLTADELRYVVHWSRTVEGVHGYQVIDVRRLKLTQVLLHARRLELERAYGSALAV